MNKTVYILDSVLNWDTFKKLNDKLVKDSGPTPGHINEMLWRMLRERKIICWFATDMPNDMGIGLEIPLRYKKWKKQLIANS